MITIFTKRNLFFGLLGLLLFFSNSTILAQGEFPGIWRIAAAGNRYATAYTDRSIRIWDANTNQLLHTLVDPSDAIAGFHVGWNGYRIDDLEFSPDGELLAASFGGFERGGQIRIFDVSSGEAILDLWAWTFASDIAWKPDGTQLAARVTSGLYSNTNPHIMVWSIPSGNLVIDQKLGSNQGGSGSDWSPDGSKLATLVANEIYLSDTTTWVREPKGVFPEGVMDIQWSPDGNKVAAVTMFGTVYIYDVVTQTVTMTLPGTSTTEYPRSLDWNANNQIAVTNTDHILVWDATTGSLLGNLEAEAVIDLAWMRNGQIVYGGSDTIEEPEILVPTIDP